jgi:hypothetical protein
MMKLLVNKPSGKQAIIYIADGGEYFDTSGVVWDERTDGVLPEITLGKMQRVNNQLVTLEDYLPEHAAAVYAESVPAEITMRQAVLALREAGYLSAVETWVANLDGELEIYWNRSLTIKRNHAFVSAAQAELELNDAEMDQLFMLAATKEA